MLPVVNVVAAAQNDFCEINWCQWGEQKFKKVRAVKRNYFDELKRRTQKMEVTVARARRAQHVPVLRG